MSTDHPHPLRLDGQGRLGRLLLWDHHHRAQVDYASAVGGAERRKITKQDFPSTPDPLSTSFVLKYQGNRPQLATKLTVEIFLNCNSETVNSIFLQNPIN